MKLIRFIKPVARLTKKQQLEATDHLGEDNDIAITIVDGEDDRTIDNAIKILKPRNGLAVHSIGAIARKRETIANICKRVFAKGANIVESDGRIHTPDDEDSLLSGLLRDKRLPRGSGKHGGHNKISQSKRDAAFLLWQTPSLPNDEVARLAGISYQAMYKWWNDEYPRNQKRGRKSAGS